MSITFSLALTVIECKKLKFVCFFQAGEAKISKLFHNLAIFTKVTDLTLFYLARISKC